MTPAMRRTLDFIEQYHAANRIAPTYREIQLAEGLASASTCFHRVERLIAQGYLRRTGGRHRGIAPASVDPLHRIATEALRAELARRETAHG